MAIDPKQSLFLRDLVLHLNENTSVGEESVSSGGKFADETRFYRATILKDPSKANASKGWPQEKTTNNEFMWVGPPDLVRMPGSRQRFAPTEGVKDAKILQTAPFANASIGAHQINGFFIKKNSVKKYFADDVFLLYMLQIYSDVKVYTDGTHAKYSPRQPDIIKYGSRNSPKSDAPSKQIKPFETRSSNLKWTEGLFDKSEYDKYDNYFKGRMLPVYLGGDWNKTVSSKAPNVQKDFKDHLAAKKEVKDWTKNERRLFLLMSGQYYGKNDLHFLNIYHANNKKIYGGIPADVRKFWKDNYQAAAAIEESDGPQGSLSKNFKGLFGENPTLQLFAKHITHGGPKGNAISAKIKNYFYYSSASTKKTRPAFMLNVYAKDSGAKTTKISLYVPKYVSNDEAFNHKAISDNPPKGLEVIKQIYDVSKANPVDNSMSYLGDFPQGKANRFFAFTSNNLLPSDKFIELETAGVPFAPSNLKTILNAASSPDTSPPDKFSLEDKGVIVKGVDAYGKAIDEWKNNKPIGPPIGEFFTIKKPNTILDFQPSKYKDKLKKSLSTAVANELPDGVGVGYFESDDLIDALYDPLETAVKVVSNEYNKYKARAAELSSRLNQDKEPSEAAKGILFDPDTSDRESLSLQLWIDSVNAAAAKVAYWVEYAQSNTSIAIRWFTVQSLVAAKKNRDEISKALQDTNLVKGKPSDQSKRPFKLDLKPPPTVPKKNLLDPEEAAKRLTERRRNIDQCLLSTNIGELKKLYNKLIVKELKSKKGVGGKSYTPHKKGAYGRRFYCLMEKNGQHTTIPNFLATPKATAIRQFLNMTPDIMSALTPKIRLYRIYRGADGKDIETEFIFNNFVSPNEVKSLAQAESIEKGRAGGIKSFSFTYEGGTPATAKKDINADLVLFFQSFNELTKLRGKDERAYKYIDLLLYPHNRAKIKNSDKIHPNQFSPTDFKIRVDVGWNKREDADFKEMLVKRLSFKDQRQKNDESGKLETEDQFGARALKEFNDGLELINKSFLLNMIDHDIDFRNDGSVEIKISYAAYIESELRSGRVNALSTPEIESYYKQDTDKINKLASDGSCTLKEINELKRLQRETRNSYIKAAQGSIVKRLINRGLQRSVTFQKTDVEEYLKEFASVPPKLSGNNENLFKAPNAVTRKERRVQFYFLGDIIHTVLDCLYETAPIDTATFDPLKSNTLEYSKRRRELKNYVPILSSFLYTDYNKKDPIFDVNISQIPISAKFFSEWMVKNVIKSDRRVYPLMNFIRDLATAVVDLMTDACINRQIDVSLMFQTAQYRARNRTKQNDKVDPLHPSKTGRDVSPVRKINRLYDKGYLPLKTSGTNEKGVVPASKFFDYTLLYAVSPTLTAGHQGTGVRSRDEKKGIYHFQIGSSRGLLKNVKFKKTDMAYLREARFFNQGNYGLLQLGAVYNVTLELFGNTIFYPGMELFIDPRGFGGADWDPTKGGRERTTANALGIGGYHTVTKVTSTISTTGFTTTVEALFQYSGEEASRTLALDGQGNKKPEPKSPKEKGSSKKPKAQKCVSALDDALKREIQSKDQTDEEKKKAPQP